MCGRFNVDINDPDMAEILRFMRETGAGGYFTHGDVFPTENAVVIASENGKAVTRVLKWGFKNFNVKRTLINARSETADKNGLFRNDFLLRRCAVPASGFYEWSKDKTKYFYRRSDNGLLYLGGFYRQYGSENEFVILTRPATYPVSEIHDRIPVILNKENVNPWLNEINFALEFKERPYDEALSVT